MHHILSRRQMCSDITEPDFISNRQMDLPDRLPLFVVGQQRQRHFLLLHRVQEAGLRGRVGGGRRDPLQAQPPHRLAAHQVQGSQVVNEFITYCS